MKFGLLCVESVILLLLGILDSNDPQDKSYSCSRDKSRIVRSIVNNKIKPILDRYRVDMPIECPFHPERDILWWPQDHLPKNGEYTGHYGFFTSWRCPVCSKNFLCAERLAIHWDMEHRLYRQRSENFVCLSDYCDLMRCDVLSHRHAYPYSSSPLSSSSPSPSSSSSPSSASNLLSRRVSLSSSASSSLFNSFSSIRSSFGSGQRSVYGPEFCNASLMSFLNQRCHSVIRQCIIPLAIGKISTKDFNDIEDEILKEVCDYLTCDKFWDFTLTEERAAPLSLCLLIGIIMIGGFCICYYIIWTLFESTIGLKPKRLMVKQVSMASTVKTAVPGLSGQVKKKLTSSGLTSITNASVETTKATSPGRELGASQEHSPASSESRYIVTGGRHFQRPGQLYLASELASMAITPITSSTSHHHASLGSSAYHQVGSASLPCQRSSSVSNRPKPMVTAVSLGSSRHPRDSPQSTKSSQSSHYYPMRRRDFALKGRRSGLSFDDDDMMAAYVADDPIDSHVNSSRSGPESRINSRIEGRADSRIEGRADSRAGETRDVRFSRAGTVRSSILQQQSNTNATTTASAEIVTTAEIESEPRTITGRAGRPGRYDYRSYDQTKERTEPEVRDKVIDESAAVNYKRSSLASHRYSSQPSTSGRNYSQYQLTKSQSNPVTPRPPSTQSTPYR